MSKCLIAEYKTKTAAKAALEVLETGGFTLENVSIVSNADDPAVKHLRNLSDDMPSEETTASATDGRNASLGMLIGGTVAAPIAAGTLIGPFIIAGPLVGIALGAAIGGLVDGMKHWGVAHEVVADYEARVKSGSMLVIVHDVNTSELSDADRLLRTTTPQTLEKYEAT